MAWTLPSAVQNRDLPSAPKHDVASTKLNGLEIDSLYPKRRQLRHGELDLNGRDPKEGTPRRTNPAADV